MKNAIDKSSLGLKSLPKIARQTLRGRHPNNPTGSSHFLYVARPIEAVLQCTVEVGGAESEGSGQRGVRASEGSGVGVGRAKRALGVCEASEASGGGGRRQASHSRRRRRFASLFINCKQIAS